MGKWWDRVNAVLGRRSLAKQKDAFRRLCTSALTATSQLLEQIQHTVKGDTEEERLERAFKVAAESAYLVLHIVERIASEWFRAPPEKSVVVRQAVAGVLLGALPEVQPGHWPVHLKPRVRAELHENLEAAVSRYSACLDLRTHGPDSQQSVYCRFGRVASDLSGNGADFSIVALISLLPVDVIETLDLVALKEVSLGEVPADFLPIS